MKLNAIRMTLVGSLALASLMTLSALTEYYIALNYFAMKYNWEAFRNDYLYWIDLPFAVAYRSNRARTVSTPVLAIISGLTGTATLHVRRVNKQNPIRALQYALVAVFATCTIAWAFLLNEPAQLLRPPGITFGELLVMAAIQMFTVLGITYTRTFRKSTRFTTKDIILASSLFALFFCSAWIRNPTHGISYSPNLLLFLLGFGSACSVIAFSKYTIIKCRKVSRNLALAILVSGLIGFTLSVAMENVPWYLGGRLNNSTVDFQPASMRTATTLLLPTVGLLSALLLPALYASVRRLLLHFYRTTR